MTPNEKAERYERLTQAMSKNPGRLEIEGWSVTLRVGDSGRVARRIVTVDHDATPDGIADAIIKAVEAAQ